jgi:hypothetical protein
MPMAVIAGALFMGRYGMRRLRAEIQIDNQHVIQEIKN